jgi:hypothetical protein
MKVCPSTMWLASSLVELAFLLCHAQSWISESTRSKKDKTTVSGRHPVSQRDMRERSTSLTWNLWWRYRAAEFFRPDEWQIFSQKRATSANQGSMMADYLHWAVKNLSHNHLGFDPESLIVHSIRCRAAMTLYLGGCTLASFTKECTRELRSF